MTRQVILRDTKDYPVPCGYQYVVWANVALPRKRLAIESKKVNNETKKLVKSKEQKLILAVLFQLGLIFTGMWAAQQKGSRKKFRTSAHECCQNLRKFVRMILIVLAAWTLTGLNAWYVVHVVQVHGFYEAVVSGWITFAFGIIALLGTLISFLMTLIGIPNSYPGWTQLVVGWNWTKVEDELLRLGIAKEIALKLEGLGLTADSTYHGIGQEMSTALIRGAIEELVIDEATRVLKAERDGFLIPKIKAKKLMKQIIDFAPSIGVNIDKGLAPWFQRVPEHALV